MNSKKIIFSESSLNQCYLDSLHLSSSSLSSSLSNQNRLSSMSAITGWHQVGAGRERTFPFDLDPILRWWVWYFDSSFEFNSSWRTEVEQHCFALPGYSSHYWWRCSINHEREASSKCQRKTLEITDERRTRKRTFVSVDILWYNTHHRSDFVKTFLFPEIRTRHLIWSRFGPTDEWLYIPVGRDSLKFFGLKRKLWFTLRQNP